VSTVAVIFARGGSKGLPQKNVRNFAGKPLIAWSIECALSMKSIQSVIVSTDSEEIAEVSMRFGAQVPFLRPKELATDHSPEWLSWKHALEFLSHSVNGLPEVMVSLPATAPLRLTTDIQNCLDEYSKGGCDAVITVTEAHRNPYFNMVRRKSDGTVRLVIEESDAKRRQDAPEVHDMATVCYVVNPHFVLSNHSLFEGRVKAVEVIDSLLDFRIAEFIFRSEWGI
jgi:CMP-N-acetylneuraminic acid synthetase